MRVLWISLCEFVFFGVLSVRVLYMSLFVFVIFWLCVGTIFCFWVRVCARDDVYVLTSRSISHLYDDGTGSPRPSRGRTSSCTRTCR